MNDYRVKQRQHYNVAKYDTYLDNSYKKFMNENKKTVMYLVKEFEMKKSAAAYKRASTDKTGIICLLYTSPSPRDVEESRMPSSA